MAERIKFEDRLLERVRAARRHLKPVRRTVQMAGSETPGQRPPEMRGICPMCLHPYTPAGPRQLWGEQICVRCFREVLERENTERFEQQFGDFRRRIWHALLLLGWIVVIALVAAHYA